MPHSDLGALIGHHKPNKLLHTRHSSERCETFKQCALCDLQQCATITTSERRETFKQCVLCEQSLASLRSSCAQTFFPENESAVQTDLLSDCISSCHSWCLAALLLSFMLCPPWSAASDRQLLPVSLKSVPSESLSAASLLGRAAAQRSTSQGSLNPTAAPRRQAQTLPHMPWHGSSKTLETLGHIDVCV